MKFANPYLLNLLWGLLLVVAILVYGIFQRKKDPSFLCRGRHAVVPDSRV